MILFSRKRINLKILVKKLNVMSKIYNQNIFLVPCKILKDKLVIILIMLIVIQKMILIVKILFKKLGKKMDMIKLIKYTEIFRDWKYLKLF